MNPVTVPELLSVCVIVALFISAWRAAESLEQPGAVSFVLFQSLIATAQAAALMVVLGVFPQWTGSIIGTIQVPLLLLLAVFASTYSGIGPQITRSRAIKIGAFIMLSAGFLSLQALSVPEWRAEYNVLADLVSVLSLFAVVSGGFLLIWSGIRDAEVPTGAGISFGLFALLNAIVLLLPSLQLFLVPIAITLVLFAQFRYRPFEGQPAMAYLTRDSAFDTMEEAVVVIDRDERVADLNTTAERTFGLDLSSAVGRPLETVLGYDPDETTTDPVSIDTTDGHRSFTVSRSPLTDRDGSLIGETFKFRDVTDEQTREEQLEVFNRVLRHNLRNDLDAIRGFAEALDEEDEDGPLDTATVAERIHSLSSELSETGATAKRAERLRTQDTLGYDQISVRELLDSVAKEIRKENPHCRLLVNTTEGEIRTDESILRTVLFEVLENAADHHPERDPTIDITATSTDEGVEITVRDDGEGIPEHHREVFLDEDPTQQQHSTGIGLWLVSWGVTRLGGELDLENADVGGAVVTLSIPDRLPRSAQAPDGTRDVGTKTGRTSEGPAEPDIGASQSR